MQILYDIQVHTTVFFIVFSYHGVSLCLATSVSVFPSLLSDSPPLLLKTTMAMNRLDLSMRTERDAANQPVFCCAILT